MTVKKDAYETSPKWTLEHADAHCPASLAELNQGMGQSIAFDPWHAPCRSSCDAACHVLAWTADEDRRFDTGDDTRSDG
jgi:hypothetical protein